MRCQRLLTWVTDRDLEWASTETCRGQRWDYRLAVAAHESDSRVVRPLMDRADVQGHRLARRGSADKLHRPP